MIEGLAHSKFRSFVSWNQFAPGLDLSQYSKQLVKTRNDMPRDFVGWSRPGDDCIPYIQRLEKKLAEVEEKLKKLAEMVD